MTIVMPFLDGKPLSIAPIKAIIKQQVAKLPYQPGNIIAIDLQHPAHFLAAYTVCVSSGYIPLIINQYPDKIQCIARDKGACCLIQAAPPPWEVEVIALNNPSVQHPPRNIGVICPTSGTTGHPRWVCWHKAGIDYQVQATIQSMGYRPFDRLAVCLPLSSAYGLSLVHIWMHYPIQLLLTSTTQLMTLVTTLTQADTYSLDASPAFYNTFLKWLWRHSSWISKLQQKVKNWCVGGDQLSSTLAKSWAATLKRPLLDGYGLTEMGPNVTLNTPQCHRTGSLGKALPETKLCTNEAGELLVKGPAMAPAHWPWEELELEDGFLPTGDLARIDEDGFVWYLGRKNNAFLIDGKKVHPEWMEKQLVNHPGIDGVLVTYCIQAGRKRLVLLLTTQEQDFDTTSLQQHCKEAFPQLPFRYIFLLPQLPLSKNGKVDRIRAKKEAEKLAQAKLVPQLMSGST